MAKCGEQPWERQKDESSKAFEGFTVYRDMGAERSLAKAGRSLGKSKTLLEKWSSQWNWVERARAYDNEIERQAKAKAVKEVKEMHSRHIKIALQLQAKALEALNKTKPTLMEPKDIKEFIKVATELERMNRIIEDDEGSQSSVIICGGDDLQD